LTPSAAIAETSAANGSVAFPESDFVQPSVLANSTELERSDILLDSPALPPSLAMVSQRLPESDLVQSSVLANSAELARSGLFVGTSAFPTSLEIGSEKGLDARVTSGVGAPVIAGAVIGGVLLLAIVVYVVIRVLTRKDIATSSGVEAQEVGLVETDTTIETQTDVSVTELNPFCTELVASFEARE
jgi:hypothetical protein